MKHSCFSWILFVLLCEFASSVAVAVASSSSSNTFLRRLEQQQQQQDEETSKVTTLFGTRNGYDRGGTDALCWQTTWNATSNTTTTTTTTTTTRHNNLIEQSNEEMFQLSEQSQLLPECFQGTNLYVISYDTMSSSDQLFLGQPYTVHMELEMDFAYLPVVLNHNNNSNNNTTTAAEYKEIYFRLHLCDAVRQGFCHPIRDTRAVDAALTREQADQPLLEDDDDDDGATLTTFKEFPDNEDKWVYNPNVTLNGLSDNNNNNGLVYYGRWCKWRLRRQNETTTLYRTSIDVTIAFPLSSSSSQNSYQLGARPFFFLGQAVVPLGRTTEGEEMRVDISQTVPSKVVYVSPPPTILRVGRRSKIALAIAIAVSGFFALVCLGAILQYHKHAILKLAQGSFLAVMTAACLIQIVFSFSFLPIRDVFCRFRGPFVEIPMTLVAAVLVGRVWRIYGTLSTVHRMGRVSNSNNKPVFETYVIGFLDGLARIPTRMVQSCCCCFPSSSNNKATTTTRKKSIRNTVTATETGCLIGMLVLPQAALQMYGATRTDAKLVTEMAAGNHVGRIVCGNDGNWVALTGTAMTCAVYLMAVFMAWFSRDLPSAFNEKDPIFHAATIGAIITAMSIAVGRIIDDPTTTPGAVVFLKSCVSMGVAWTVLYSIVWPKIVRARSGQEVVVSSLLGSKFSHSSENTSQSGGDTNNNNNHHHGDDTNNNNNSHCDNNPPAIVQWNEHQALPKHIESQILELQMTFRGVTHKCGDGRSLSKEEWCDLQESIRQLYADLNSVHVE